MAYDEGLAARVREHLSTRTDVDEKKMFGGLVFMVNTHMACGIVKSDLMLRLGKDSAEGALDRGARSMEMAGRPMPGMVTIDAADVSDAVALGEWVDEAVSIATAKDPKPPTT